jgi:hypothetical protein
LAVLAQDAANVDLVLSLAKHERIQGPAPEWEVNLLTALAQSAAYGRALDLWQRLSGATAAKDSVFNPRFTDSSAPGPFNWTLASGAGGVAEAKAGGLRVLFFGRDNVEFARQTVLLSPGRYELSMRGSGSFGAPGSLRWSVYCLKDNAELLRLPVKSGQIGAQFQVPSTCPAQAVVLAGEVQDVAQQADFVVDRLSLRKVGA